MKLKVCYVAKQHVVRHDLAPRDMLIIRDADVMLHDTPGFVRIRGTRERWSRYLSFDYEGSPPAGWPTRSVDIPWWDPDNWLRGIKARVEPEVGWHAFGLEEIDIVVSAGEVSGQPDPQQA